MFKVIVFVLASSFIFAASSHGKELSVKNRSQEVVTDTIATKPSDIYRFETFNIDSVDGQRHYRIQLAVPVVPVPKQGFPAIFMLDGNAAMASLTADDVKRLNHKQATVLVAVGYDVDTRNDPIARAFDYTPPVYKAGKQVTDPTVLGKTGGGAAIFLELLEQKIFPLVQQKVLINSSDTTFWGHSYGGLFVLYTLIKKPDLFDAYMAADPSVWWYSGAIKDDWDGMDKKQLTNKKVSILTGTKPHSKTTPFELDAKNKNIELKDPDIILHQIISDLARNQAKLKYITYPENGHGEMISASLQELFQ